MELPSLQDFFHFYINKRDGSMNAESHRYKAVPSSPCHLLFNLFYIYSITINGSTPLTLSIFSLWLGHMLLLWS